MLTHVRMNMSGEIPPPFKTKGARQLVLAGPGFYPVCRGRHSGPGSSPGLFLGKKR